MDTWLAHLLFLQEHPTKIHTVLIAFFWEWIMVLLVISMALTLMYILLPRKIGEFMERSSISKSSQAIQSEVYGINPILLKLSFSVEWYNIFQKALVLPQSKPTGRRIKYHDVHGEMQCRK